MAKGSSRDGADVVKRCRCTDLMQPLTSRHFLGLCRSMLCHSPLVQSGLGISLGIFLQRLWGTVTLWGCQPTSRALVAVATLLQTKGNSFIHQTVTCVSSNYVPMTQPSEPTFFFFVFVSAGKCRTNLANNVANANYQLADHCASSCLHGTVQEHIRSTSLIRIYIYICPRKTMLFQCLVHLCRKEGMQCMITPLHTMHCFLGKFVVNAGPPENRFENRPLPRIQRFRIHMCERHCGQ